MAVVLTAAEVNALVYHYLLEAGLQTAAFALKVEADLQTCEVVPGALLTYLEKALIFTQIEAHHFKDPANPGKSCTAEMRLLAKHECTYQEIPVPANEMTETNGNTSLAGHSAPITSVCWAPFSQVILTTAQDGDAKLWRTENQVADSKAVAVLPHFTKSGLSGKPIHALNWTVSPRQPQGLAVTISEDGMGRLWDVRGNLVQVMMEQTGMRLGQWNRAGTSLATVGKENFAAVWSATGSLIKQFHPVDSPITAIEWQGDSEFLLGTESGAVLVCSPNHLQALAFVSHTGPVRLLACHPSGDFCAAASTDTLQAWMVTGASLLQQTATVTSLAWNPKFNVLTIGLSSGRIYSWDASSRATVETSQKHQGPVTHLVYRTEGDLFASAGADNRLLIWNLRDGRLLYEYQCKDTIHDL